MEQHIIDNLPNILKNHIDTLENTSKDNNNNHYMTNCKKGTINFDRVKVEYKNNNNIKDFPSSNDALYITANNDFYFIEFKNSTISEYKLKNKIYDSLLILSNIKYNNGANYINDIVEFSKSNIEYILVYNSSKNGKLHINNNINNKAGKQTTLYGILKLKGFIFRDINFYSEKQFNNKFINNLI